MAADWSGNVLLDSSLKENVVSYLESKQLCPWNKKLAGDCLPEFLQDG